MHLCVFEDDRVNWLEPLVLTRPAFDLWCGTTSLLHRQCRYFRMSAAGFFVRPFLADRCRFLHPKHLVNNPACLQDDMVLLVNARWFPPAGERPDNLTTPHVALLDGEIAYAVVPSADCSSFVPESLAEQLTSWSERLPPMQAGGRMIGNLWDLLTENTEAITQDFREFGMGALSGVREPGPVIIGPRGKLYIAPDARVEFPAVVDTTQGPVIIDAGALVKAPSRLEGPCYIGVASQVLGGCIRASTIGPCCRVGGEMEASILLGHDNKYHEGFLGHSYLGEWVNLGAGTQVSDLRNDYATIRVQVAGEKVDTGLLKVGAFLGDHVRTGVGTLLNCGTVAGAFSHLLPSGSYLPRVVPSFCTVRSGQLQERGCFRELFAAAAVALSRRGQDWTEQHDEFFLRLYAATAGERESILRQSGSRGPSATPCCRPVTRSAG